MSSIVCCIEICEPITNISDSLIDTKTVKGCGKLCESVGCGKKPYYGIIGENARFCATHKDATMVAVKTKRCEHVGCTKQPSFDVVGGKGRFCATHKEPTMVDVRNKK
jgi:hypothetical protein